LYWACRKLNSSLIRSIDSLIVSLNGVGCGACKNAKFLSFFCSVLIIEWSQIIICIRIISSRDFSDVFVGLRSRNDWSQALQTKVLSRMDSGDKAPKRSQGWIILDPDLTNLLITWFKSLSYMIRFLLQRDKICW